MTPSASQPDPRTFLEHFPPGRRSTIANWFHYAVRGGASTPGAVCSAVWQTVQRRLQWRTDPETIAQLTTVLEALQHDQAAALAYATSVIAYEALPYADRQRVKAERSIAFLASTMVGKEPTTKQLNYLLQLGYRGAPPVDRAQASALIDHLRQGKGRV